MSDWNDRVIAEFRANGGAVAGPFAGRPLLLLHTTGARSGRPHVTPLMYRQSDGGYAVFASKGGADTHPDWYLNLLADPHARIEVGTETLAVTARVLDGAERDTIWSLQKQEYPMFAEYERTTRRTIPVILLEPRS